MAKASSLPPLSETPLRVVAIGGGTGLSTLLRGLKPYARESHARNSPFELRFPVVDITAVVTVTDDGGSSGRLRREFDVLPPGDIRTCMVALSEDEALLSRLFQYRFPTGRGLKGHSFGNLFLTALMRITGDFPQAVAVSSEILASAGRIYPSTAADVVLEAKLMDGTSVAGESRISKSRSPIRSLALKPRGCRPLRETLEAISAADIITFGPGSLFTSVIPNLLVRGIPRAIRQSPAVKAYIVNLMWQPGETTNFTAADHVAAILKHARIPLDCILLNTRPISAAMKRRYERERAEPVVNDLERLTSLGRKPLLEDLLDESEKVRHDPARLARVVVRLASEGRARRRDSTGTSR